MRAALERSGRVARAFAQVPGALKPYSLYLEGVAELLQSEETPVQLIQAAGICPCSRAALQRQAADRVRGRAALLSTLPQPVEPTPMLPRARATRLLEDSDADGSSTRKALRLHFAAHFTFVDSDGAVVHEGALPSPRVREPRETYKSSCAT